MKTKKEKEEIVIYLSRHGFKPFWKNEAICRTIGNISYPIIYLKKAKGATDEEYWIILDHLFQPDKKLNEIE